MPFTLPNEAFPSARIRPPERKLMTLPVDSIRPNPNQPRKTFDPTALNELKESIRQAGLIQPLVVRKVDGAYELIAGERRLRACKLLNMREVPCVVLGGTQDIDSALMALTENVQRQNLHFFEEAACYRTLLHAYGLTQEALSQKLGKSQSFLANKLRLLHLSPAVRRAMADTGLTERHARALLRLREEKLQLETLNRVVERSLNVKETERLVERLLAAAAAAPKPRRIRLIKDYRLFVNTVKCGLDQLRDTGLKVELVQTELDDGMDMVIRVRKPLPAAPKPQS